MKIKLEKPSFSDVDGGSASDADSGPEDVKPTLPANIKEESPPADGAFRQPYAMEAASFASLSPEENIKALDACLGNTSLTSQMILHLKRYFTEFDFVRPLRATVPPVEIDLANPDEETWIVQCPASVDIHRELLHKKLNLTEPRSKIKRCSVPLEAHIKVNSDEHALGLMCGTQVKSFRPAGFVRISEAIPSSAPLDVQLPTDSGSQDEVPYPVDIRQRHPLLGYDFESTMLITDRVKARLARARQQAEAFYMTPPSAGAAKKPNPKSKTKKIKLGPEQEEAVSPKKSKKRKHSVTEENDATSEPTTPSKVTPVDESSSPRKKSKSSTTPTVKSELPVADDLAWLLNI